MPNLCPTCLNTIKKEEKICTICGTKVKRNWKKPLKISSIALIILALLSTPLLYLKWHFSSEKVAASFYEALENRDVQSIKSLVVHEDQTTISTTEAKAVIDLITELGEIEVDQFFSSTQQNSFLKLYKMTADPVSIKPVEKPLQFKIKDADPSNLIPGKYNVTLTKEDTLISKVNETVLVQKKNTTLPKIPKSQTLSVAQAYNFPLITYDSLSVTLNGKTTSLDEMIQNEPVTIFYNKLPIYQIIGNWPWGKVTSDSYHLDDGISFEVIPFINEKQERQLVELSHDVLSDLSAGRETKKQVSSFFRSTKKQLLSPLRDDFKIEYFSAVDLTVDDQGKINGVYSTFSSDSIQYNVHFIFDEASLQWQLNDLKSNNLMETDDFTSATNANYTLSRVYEIPFTEMNDGQLKILIRKIYTFNVGFPSPSVDYSDHPQAKPSFPACSEVLFYDDWEIVSVHVLNATEAEVNSINTCIDGMQYDATTFIKKNGHDAWLFRESKPRQKIQP